MGVKPILIFLMVTYGCCVTFGCCSKMTVKKESRVRDKRNIPYAGQTLQATYNILSHPIVAAALQKISMDAMATVASALKEVHQSEENEKKKKLMTKTLDKISNINNASLRQPMPLLHDFDDGSGSGGASRRLNGLVIEHRGRAFKWKVQAFFLTDDAKYVQSLH